MALPPDHTTVGRVAGLLAGWRAAGWGWLARRILSELAAPVRLAGKLRRVAIVAARLGPRAIFRPPAPPGDVLTLFYDLEVSPITFDCLWALAAAQMRARELGLARVRFALVPGRFQGVRRERADYEKAIPPDARRARVEAIVLASARLAPCVSEIVVLPDRAAAETLRAESGAVYPENYWPQFPRAHHPRDLPRGPGTALPTVVAASESARASVAAAHDAQTGARRLVTITLRDYAEAPARNSRVEEWLAFARGLDPARYRVVFVPDTSATASSEVRLAPFAVDRDAAGDVDRRLALYERAWLNLFVNNGPYALCAFDAKCRYAMLKILTPGVMQTEAAYLTELGFEIGATPAGANPHQLWVWEDDTRDAIGRAFAALQSRIEAEAAVVANGEALR
jgi:hypothetical protein